MTTREEWRTVEGFEGYYEVSSLGRVRSIRRTVTDRMGRRHPVRSRILAARAGTGGYCPVRLHRPGRIFSVMVHRLVAHAFLGPRPEGKQVAHNDGDPSNNAATNLRYVTPRENQADRKLHGTEVRGSRHPNAKLTEADVLAMRRAHLAGDTYAAIAARHGVDRKTATLAVRGRAWTHVGAA